MLIKPNFLKNRYFLRHLFLYDIKVVLSFLKSKPLSTLLLLVAMLFFFLTATTSTHWKTCLFISALSADLIYTHCDSFCSSRQPFFLSNHLLFKICTLKELDSTAKPVYFNPCLFFAS